MKFGVALALAVVAVTSVGAIAETAKERQACMDDAFSVCGHAIPDRDRVEACLYENKNRISSACRAVLNKYSKPASITAARTKAATVR